MNPLVDVIIIWKGFGCPNGRNFSWESKARLTVWYVNGTNIVLFSDLDEVDTGTSITNSSENIATLVHNYYNLVEPIRWFEYYPSIHCRPDLSEVFYSNPSSALKVEYTHPTWKHITVKQFEEEIGLLLGDAPSSNSLPIVRLQ